MHTERNAGPQKAVREDAPLCHCSNAQLEAGKSCGLEHCLNRGCEARGRFVLEIEPSNAMQTVDDVADALHRLANRIGGQGWVGEGKVGDIKGATVGRWTFHDQNWPDDIGGES